MSNATALHQALHERYTKRYMCVTERFTPRGRAPLTQPQPH